MNVKGLKAEAVVLIKILDENDNIPEITGNLNGVILEHEPVGTFVMQVKAHDNDGTSAHNIVSYRLEGTARQYFHIDSKTGNITSLVEFDREAKDIYPVTVVAEDNSPSVLFNNGKPNSAVKQLFIRVLDKRDHPPQFEEQYYEVNNIPEDADTNTSVIKVKATDLDKDPKIKYSIIENNIGKAFKIDEDTDENGKGRTAMETVYIFVEDINDNAPQLTNRMPVVWSENRPSAMITKLTAEDADGEHNGPPFFYSVDPDAPTEIKNRFQTVGDELYSLVEFDREQQKQYLVPILIRDSGHKPMSAVSKLLVVIGDKNDNEMQWARATFSSTITM
uniref:Cadherin domain-containing protein n=1 Tax=Anopheles coluzzii TaxID=1518534 RepID=A0A8W7P206_ANOCL